MTSNSKPRNCCPICEGSGILSVSKLNEELGVRLRKRIKRNTGYRNWWNQTVERVVDLEVFVLTGDYTLAGALVRAAGQSAGFDPDKWIGRLALQSLSLCVDDERERRRQEDAVASVVLKDTDFGGGLFELQMNLKESEEEDK